MYNRRRKIARANWIAKMLKFFGSPTESPYAYELWELLSSHSSPIDYETAKKLYLKAGYQPFMGYPLTHKQNCGK